MHYTQYWSVTNSACVRPGPDRMTWLVFRSPGSFTLHVPKTPEGLVDAATSGSGRCG
jgi:hypothetical protein